MCDVACTVSSTGECYYTVVLRTVAQPKRTGSTIRSSNAATVALREHYPYWTAHDSLTVVLLDTNPPHVVGRKW